ncbi:hypothetical protein N2152v2_007804 [Parachlorella kessleri]
MLAVHCKRGEPVDLKDPVLEYVSRTYGQQAVGDVGDELDDVQTRRNDLINASGVLPTTRSSLAKYYRILTLMETRFPISRGAGNIPLCFVWYDAFRNTKRSEQCNIHFEKSAIVFNLGAVQSQAALAADRKTEDGLKESAKFFQEAAGSFAFLRDVACLKVESPRPVDISPECATMLEKLMLAQAQECVLETAVLGKKSPAILARLAKQHFDRSWLSHATVKGMLYEAESLMQSGAAFRTSEDIDGVAKEIARLRTVLALLANCKREAKNASRELQEAAQAKEEAAVNRLARAEKENATVYLQRVPNDADLAAVAPASLVKSVQPADLRPAGEESGMFGGVIPESSARSLSKYTDMVDSLIRTQLDKLAAASDDARLRLREWELPECLQALDARSTAALPDAVRVELESVQDAGGAGHLQDLVAQIRELKRVAGEELNQCEVDLDAEAREDDELRAHYAARWTRTPSAQLTRVMRDKVQGYRSNLSVAGDSDTRLEQRLAAESAAFAALDPEAAAAQMPRLQAPMLSVDNMEPATIVATLRQALESLATLSSQRAALEEALKASCAEQKNKDNILPKLMAGGAGEPGDALFKEELKKYDELVKEVDANIDSQAQVLEVIARNQEAYRTAYGYNEWRKSCEVAAQDIRKGVATYAELRDNLSEGLRFYTSLQEAIATLRQQVGDHCMTRKIQRDDIIDDLKRQADQQATEAQQRAEQQMAALKLAESQAAAQAAAATAAAAAPPPPPPSAHAPAAAPAAGGAPSPPPSQHPQQQQQQGGGASGGYGAYPPPSYGSGGYGAPGGYQQPMPHASYYQPPYGGYAPPPPAAPAYPGGPPPPPYYQGGYPQQPTFPQAQYRQGYDNYGPPPAYGGGYGSTPPPPQQQGSSDWSQQQQQYQQGRS